MRSIKEECPDRMIFFGEKSLLNAMADFLVHYHQERNCRGLSNRLPWPGNEMGDSTIIPQSAMADTGEVAVKASRYKERFWDRGA